MSVQDERVLLVGTGRTGSLERAYAGALRRKKIQLLDQFDPELAVSSLNRSRVLNRLTFAIQDELASASLYRFLQERKNYYTLIIVVKGLHLSPKWLVRCKTITHPTIWLNINPDDPFNLGSRGASNRNILHAVPIYDMYATWKQSLIPNIQSAGCAHTFYLPFAYNADEHYPADPQDRSLSEAVCFIGAWDKQREEILTAVADFPLLVCGYGWERVGLRSPLRGKTNGNNVYGVELRRMIFGCKAALNILRPQNYGAHNMRTFEIPAMQGVMVTARSVEQSNYFPETQASLMYESADELRAVLKRIMANDVDSSAMRLNGFEHSRRHSYDERASQILETVARYRQCGSIA